MVNFDPFYQFTTLNLGYFSEWNSNKRYSYHFKTCTLNLSNSIQLKKYSKSITPNNIYGTQHKHRTEPVSLSTSGGQPILPQRTLEWKQRDVLENYVWSWLRAFLKYSDKKRETLTGIWSYLAGLKWWRIWLANI